MEHSYEDEEDNIWFAENLPDASQKETGRKSKEQLATAKKHLNTFLKSHEDKGLSKLTVDSLEPFHATSELMGRFGSYLFYMVTKLKKQNTALPYLSQIKQFFDKKWENDISWPLHPSRNNGQWYSVLRKTVAKLYSERHIADGTAMVDQAPPLFRDSLKKITQLLFELNTKSNFKDRDLLITQWLLMGRGSETGLKHSSVTFVGENVGAMRYNVGRSKTQLNHVVHAFCDADSWITDIFHARACHFITNTKIDDDFLFKGSSVNYINKLLTKLFDKYEVIDEKFQSHSGRRGSATTALSNPSVTIAEVGGRGGWIMDAISRVFVYYCGMDKGDMKVGRVCSGWKQSENGGIPPSLEDLKAKLSEEENITLDAFTNELFRNYITKYKKGFLEVLTASLLQYYQDVITFWEKKKS